MEMPGKLKQEMVVKILSVSEQASYLKYFSVGKARTTIILCSIKVYLIHLALQVEQN